MGIALGFDREGPSLKAFVGTSGFSYKEWLGHFYPLGTKPGEFLEHYSARLGSVEINNTFYRLPRPAMLESWRDRTPENFRFAIKASRRITHFKKLRETKELLVVLATSVASLGSRLGPLLFQTPPQLRADLELLRDFLGDVDAAFSPSAGGPRIALEFRHPSWLTGDVFSMLRDRSIALCGSDGDDDGRVPVDLVKTAPFSYLRLRKEDYQPFELAEWADRLHRLECEEAFVYFKHEQTGPDLALRLSELLACRGSEA